MYHVEYRFFRYLQRRLREKYCYHVNFTNGLQKKFSVLSVGTLHISSQYRSSSFLHLVSSFHSSVALQKKRKTREEKAFKNIIQFKPKPKLPVLNVWPGITISELAKVSNRMIGQVFEAMSYIENCDRYKKSSSPIYDRIVLEEIAKKLGYRVYIGKNPGVTQQDDQQKTEDLCRRPPADPKDLVKRPPVVAIMGHVDHGKTTLLDTLRHSSIVSQEHGGITQHIGAFTVKLPKGQITFLDTPGHAAFHAMRARGAHATDIVVLVVAADDSVMEQTLESIRFANEANVPMIVAINKIDKPVADVERVKKDLLGYGIQLEEYGGDTQAVCVSALKNMNLDLLTDAILVQAEVMEIASDLNCPVEGVILETLVDDGKGKLATVLIQRGVLKRGLFIVAGTAWAKVRAMYDEHGKTLTEVSPGLPVQISGWKILPEAGQIVLQAESEKHAQRVIEYRRELVTQEKMVTESLIIQKKLDEHLEKYRSERYDRLLRGRYRKGRTAVKEKEYIIDATPALEFVLKGDVHGSLEALLDVLGTYQSHDKCRLEVVHYGLGDISENDIMLAESFEGLIYAFNVGVSPKMKQLAEARGVTIKSFNVIYHLVDDIKQELSIRLPQSREVEIMGEAAVLQVFTINEGKAKVSVAGCRCTKGTLQKGSLCQIMRSDEVIYEGILTSLKHEKSDVETIKKNVECGVRIDNPNIDFVVGDNIVCVKEKYVPQRTDWDTGF